MEGMPSSAADSQQQLQPSMTLRMQLQAPMESTSLSTVSAGHDHNHARLQLSSQLSASCIREPTATCTRTVVNVLPNLPEPRATCSPGPSAISSALKNMNFTGTLILEPGVYEELGPIHVEGGPSRDLAIIGSGPGVQIVLRSSCEKASPASIVIIGNGGKGLIQNILVSGIRFEVAGAKWFVKDVSVDRDPDAEGVGKGPGIWAAPLGLRSKLWIMRTSVANCGPAPAMLLEHPDGSYIVTDCRMANSSVGASVAGIGGKATFERCLVDGADACGLVVESNARGAAPGCVFRGCAKAHEARGTGTLTDIGDAAVLEAGAELPAPVPTHVQAQNAPGGHVFLSAGVKQVAIPPSRPRPARRPSPSPPAAAVPVGPLHGRVIDISPRGDVDSPPCASSPDADADAEPTPLPPPASSPSEEGQPPRTPLGRLGLSMRCSCRERAAKLCGAPPKVDVDREAGPEGSWSPSTASPVPVLAWDPEAGPVAPSRNPFTSECLTPHAMFARAI